MKKFLFVVASILGIFLLLGGGKWLESKKAMGKNLFPDASYKPSISQGKTSYQSSCIGCHGASLLGTKQGPPLLDVTYKPSHHADLAFYYAIRSGVKQHHWHFGDMPIITGLSAEKVSDIIAYVRQQQKISNIK